MMTTRDLLLEDIYDLIQQTGDERAATDAARIGKLAIQYRLNQIKRQRTQRAIEKRAEERALLKASIPGDRGAHSQADDRLSPESRPGHIQSEEENQCQ